MDKMELQNELHQIKIDMIESDLSSRHCLLNRQIGTIFEQRVKAKTIAILEQAERDAGEFEDGQTSFLDMAYAYQRYQRKQNGYGRRWVMNTDQAQSFCQAMANFFPKKFTMETSIEFFLSIADLVNKLRTDARGDAHDETIEEDELILRVQDDQEMKSLVDALIATANEPEFRGLKPLKRLPSKACSLDAPMAAYFSLG